MKKHALDATDIRILCALQQHGPLSKSRLSELVNISPTPCWTRLDRLKAAGYIRGFHADIALERLTNFTQVTVTVAMTSHRQSAFDRFEAWVRAQDEIVNCVATGGGTDYVMTVIAPDLSRFQALMQTMLDDELGVERYMIYINTRFVKSSQPNLRKLLRPSD